MPPDLRYERFSPDPVLAPHVEHFWMVSSDLGDQVRREILIPNGRPTIVVCLADPGARIDPRDGTVAPNTGSVAGIATRPLVLEQSGRSLYLGAQFAPWGLGGWFERDRLVDRALPLRDWLGPAATEALRGAARAAGFGPKAAGALADVLRARLRPVAVPGPVCDAVARIDADPAAVEVERLAADSGVAPSTLYRRFRAAMGVGPKSYVSVMRFWHLAGALLGTAPGDSLALLAAMQGYYDQAHAAKEFRRFTGIGQRAFRETLNGIAALMHRD